MSLGEIPGLRARILEHYHWVQRRDQIFSETGFAKKYPQFSQHQANDWFSEKKTGAPDFANLQKLADVFGVTWQELLVGIDGAQLIRKTQKEIRERRKREEKELEARIGTEHLRREMSKQEPGRKVS